MPKHAAITFVSKNYFSYAKTLAESYKTHHPENDFLIILVDKADGYVAPSLSCGAEVIEIASLAIPDLGRFIYRYSIMELNTAVKPFALADLFNRRRYDTLLYIDPDILIFRPLTDIYDAFDSASIVLTPHIRRPYYDDRLPSDLTILQSGTYNLGFLGLKNSKSSTRMLEWWMTKCYRDCVVDIPNGLFVDQKWIDLIPGFFPDHKIIYGAGYNAAYWNLHERSLSRDADKWTIDGEPLSFFHFSGYIPFAPHSLSKHQDRHVLENMPTLRVLTDLYGNMLFENGYEESSSWPYAFEKLGNGVPIPLDLVRLVMQWASRAGVATPSPVEDPDGFCRFLMSRNVLPGQPNSVLLFHFLLQHRPDVAAAYPKARDNHDDEDFRAWIRRGGTKDVGFEELLGFEGTVDDHIADAFNRLREGKRQDIFDKFRDMWVDPEIFEAFANWFTAHGIKQMKFKRAHGDALKRSVPAIGRILNIYFLRGDIQIRFPVLWDQVQIEAFANWLSENRYALDLTKDEIALFSEFALASNSTVEKMRFLYQHKSEKTKVVPNIYSIDARRDDIGSILSTEKVLEFLNEESSVDPADHYLFKYGKRAESLDDFGKLSVPGLEPRKDFAFVRRLRQSITERRSAPGQVNFAGYLDAPSGMGESGRSMRTTLEQTGMLCRPMSLPHPQAMWKAIPAKPEMFGWPISCADVSITVANADTSEFIESFLPQPYWANKNVGYWVWEAEEFPFRLKEGEKLFDEVWTPSKYSALAIGRTIDRPVRVLPHTLDFAAIATAQAKRKKFGLPEGATLFGFIFDSQSVIERKNVSGLVKAFRDAFRDDDQCYLVLKVSGKTQGAYDYEMIRAAAEWDRILFLEAIFSRDETFDFMKSLDVYVSLHRSEGFGLTCAEAMAVGLPVVASNYSGNLEFMTDDNSLLIPVTVVDTDRPYGAYPAGTRWGAPDLEAASNAMRSLLDKARRLDIGKTGRESVHAALSKEKIGAIARSLIVSLREQSANGRMARHRTN